MVVQDEDLEVGGSVEPLADPPVALAPDLALVEVGLTRVDPDDANTVDVGGPVRGTDQLLEVEVTRRCELVIAEDRVDRRLDPLPRRPSQFLYSCR